LFLISIINWSVIRSVVDVKEMVVVVVGVVGWFATM
jgi:hypothetical protein